MEKIKSAQFILIAFLIFFSLTPHANTRDGFYAGAGLGSTTDELELKTTHFSPDYTFHNTIEHDNIVGNIFAGYGYTTPNSLFVGGELGTNFPKRSLTAIGLPSGLGPYYTVTNTLYVQDYITIDILPGYVVNQNLLLYGRAGLSYGSLSLRQLPRYGLAGVTKSNNALGGRFGLGANYDLNNQWGIALDYDYTLYQKIDMYTYPYATEYSTKTTSNFFGISVLYHM